jgi:hypothetical protein
MSHGDAIYEAAKAAFDEYERIERPYGPMRWEELDQESKSNWAAIARAVLIAYKENR